MEILLHHLVRVWGVVGRRRTITLMSASLDNMTNNNIGKNGEFGCQGPDVCQNTEEWKHLFYFMKTQHNNTNAASSMSSHPNTTHNNNNNGFRVRFGVQRRHRGPPFALGYHQFIIIVAIQDEGEGEGGTLAGSVIPCICPG